MREHLTSQVRTRAGRTAMIGQRLLQRQTLQLRAALPLSAPQCRQLMRLITIEDSVEWSYRLELESDYGSEAGTCNYNVIRN